MEIFRPHSHRNSLPSYNNDAVAVPTLPLYRSAPPLEVRLEDFESFAIDRLRVLRGISDGLSRGKKPEEMEKLVKDMWKVHMRHQHASEDLNKDIISHFVLRLVYCRTEDLRKWFLSMESALFRYRFRRLTAEAQRAVMDEFDHPYRAVSNMEFESIKEKLGQVARSMGQLSPTADAIFYKVPFEEVPELVAGRKVFISQGYAYVAMNQVVSLVATLFRSQLSKTLILTNRKWTSSIREQEKHRLTPIVEALCSSYLGPDFSQPREYAEISLKDIDQVAKSSFPLCMRHLFDKLREDHHLKHGGRMQLGLFLKGVGLKLDDALAFWRAEFSKKVGLEKFEKEYAYNIRHNYGKEGKRTDYTPYSCQKIISSTPGAGDQHGCPYRHFSQENLRAALSRMGVNSGAMEDVMDKVRNRHYQLACTLTFEALHGVPCDAGINHPNQYFSDSQKILQPKKCFECKPDAITSSTMVCAYARANNVDKAQSLYDRAKTEKWPLDSVTFSALIKMYDMSGNYDGCLNVYLDMKAFGVKPNVETYNTLLVAMLRAKRPWQAKTIYEEMKNNGVSPDFTTYSTLLRVYTRSQYGKDALGIYKEMKENGMDVSIDLYNVLLAMCADVGCADEAVEIFEDMKSSGTCRPDIWTFSALINVYSCGGKVSEAEAMLNEMIESGFEPNIFVMTSLVHCYGKAKRTDDVVRIFNQLLDLGITPDDRFCGCLLNVMTQTPKEELGKLIDCVERANTKLGSVVRYLVEGREEGDGDFRKEASEFFSSVDDDVKKSLCNCLIDLCVNLNVPDRASDLFHLGLMLGIYRDIQSISQTQWSLHLKKLSVGAAMIALHVWINDLSKTLESGEELPPLLGINTGRGKHKHSSKGLASVFESHLKELNAPFREAPDKAGWFLVKKEAAKTWLQSRGSTETVAALDSPVLGAPTMALHF